ncbi:hypothetical protein [Rubripirellula tenax]|uniref:hypothetical protein n=1 Tax=Rubripirellula tenax TaxID=2528015 RepID=UPI0011B6109F|nr:hypothetical protein [Rubripirellula tenax]
MLKSAIGANALRASEVAIVVDVLVIRSKTESKFARRAFVIVCQWREPRRTTEGFYDTAVTEAVEFELR